jgi:glutamate dehydrogenase/leucine dehydrogenase
MNRDSEFDSHLYRTALTQLDRVAQWLNLDTDIHERLRHPRRALVVSIPARMDDGTTQVFRGYRVHHSTVLGPTKGGVRYDLDVNLGEVSSGARPRMTSLPPAFAGVSKTATRSPTGGRSSSADTGLSTNLR